MAILETQAFVDIVCCNVFCKYRYFDAKIVAASFANSE